MSRQRVLILGAGPAAAYAVLAARAADCNVTILSNSAPNTEQAGAFFLHWLPEDIKAEPVPVDIRAVGDRLGYLTKQWGEEWSHIATSFPERPRVELWYNSTALKQVWAREHVGVVSALDDAVLRRYGQEFDWVFHTFPATAASAVRQLVLFPVLSVMSAGPASTLRIIYNGDPHWWHTRTTVAWGRTSIEFPRDTKAETLDAVAGLFPGPCKRNWLRDIYPGTAAVSRDEWLAPNVVPVGRFAQWERSALSHDAYARVYGLLKGERHE